MKDLNLKALTAKLSPFLDSFKRYLAFMCVIAFVCAYAFLVFRINVLARSEPGEDAVAEKLQTSKQPKIDQSAVTKLEQLQDQNIEVKALFQQARQNPFTE